MNSDHPYSYIYNDYEYTAEELSILSGRRIPDIERLVSSTPDGLEHLFRKIQEDRLNGKARTPLIDTVVVCFRRPINGVIAEKQPSSSGIYRSFTQVEDGTDHEIPPLKSLLIRLEDNSPLLVSKGEYEPVGRFFLYRDKTVFKEAAPPSSTETGGEIAPAPTQRQPCLAKFQGAIPNVPDASQPLRNIIYKAYPVGPEKVQKMKELFVITLEKGVPLIVERYHFQQIAIR